MHRPYSRESGRSVQADRVRAFSLTHAAQGKEVAVKQYITYKIKQIQEGVMRSFNYEKRMMKCAISIARMLSTFRLLSEHPHPNIIACYGVCSSEETPALIMDHIPKVRTLIESPMHSSVC